MEIILNSWMGLLMCFPIHVEPWRGLIRPLYGDPNQTEMPPDFLGPIGLWLGYQLGHHFQ